MLYQNTSQLIEFLKKNQLWNKKKLGQNFLVNPSIIEKIIETADIQWNELVMEVGPGLGILTEAILEKTPLVRSIEFDPTLIPILQKTFPTGLEKKIPEKFRDTPESTKVFPHFELIHADALTVPLPHQPYKLVANIPYYITSPLLNHYLQPKSKEEKRPTLIVLLVQKEVAEKICSREGDHSILSLQVQIFGKPEIVGTVGKSNFFPQPEVDSSIIKIEMHTNPLVENTEVFFKLAKAAFSQKRKTIENSLANGLRLPRQTVTTFLRSADIDPMRRPQTLNMEEWNLLTRNATSILPKEKPKK